MKHKVFFFAVLLIALTIPQSVFAYDFSAVSPSGHTLYYNISGSNVSVTSPDNSYSGSYIGYSKPTGNLEIPSSVTYSGITYSVTLIDDYAFSDCSGLTLVTIPNSITSIGQGAFHSCFGLSSVTIPNSVTSIGRYAFMYVRHIEYYGTATGAPWGAVSMNGTVDGDFVFSSSAEDTLLAYIGEGGAVTIPNTVTLIDHEAFRYCSGLTSVTIPNSVTTIGEGAFRNCSGLTSVTIPNSITSIGVYAFYECSGLTSVTIPNSVTSIGGYAFYGCSGLTSVTIPNSVNLIDDGAFRACSGLTTVTVPNSVITIGMGAFEECSGLTSVSIPNSVTSISEGMFAGCSNLPSVTIPSSVTLIGRGAFWGCSSLLAVTIPEAVTSIGEDAFRGCSSLTSVSIPNAVTSIGGLAFFQCSSLTSVSIPNSVTSIGFEAFGDCSGLTSVILPNAITSISEEVFSRCTGLTSVTIPSSVTSIGVLAFFNCINLTEITCLATIAPTLGGNVFYNVSTTIPVYVPCGSVANYQAATGWSSFTNIQGEVGYTVSVDSSEHGHVDVVHATCDNPTATLTAVPDAGFIFDHWNDGDTNNPRTINVTSDTTLMAYFVDESILDFIFADAARTQLKKYIGTSDTVVIPSTTVIIMDSAFQDCSWITSVTIPNSVISIGSNAFYQCYGLSAIEIPESVISIDSWAFASCTTLTSVTFSHGLTFIGSWAFGWCNELTSVTIPSSVTSIGNAPFGYCGLTTIEVDEGNNYYDSRDNCNAIIETSSGRMIHGSNTTIIPNTVTKIGDFAFSNCSGITSMTIPNSVTSIGNHAFHGCYLTSITIPNSVDSIGSEAFRYNNLTSVFIPQSVTYLGYTPFLSCPNITTISVSEYNTHYDSRDNCNAIIETNTNRLVQGCNYSVIPNSVSSIGDYAFQECSSMTSITIPSTVTSIGTWSFIGCHGLREIHVLASEPPMVGDNAFLHVNDTIPIYIPCGVVSAYQSVGGWNVFSNIQEEYDYSVSVGENDLGNVNIVQPTCGNPAATLTAVPDAGFVFDHWSDGDTNNPRTINVTSDTTLTAYFDTIKYMVGLSADNITHGTVQGAGTYAVSDTVTLSAISYCNYRFLQWSNGVTENPYLLTVCKDTNLVALFEEHYDTIHMHDTTFVDVHDTTYINIHDTTYVYHTRCTTLPL